MQVDKINKVPDKPVKIAGWRRQKIMFFFIVGPSRLE
jgi:hypothetical protein